MERIIVNISKELEIPSLTLGNIIVDGLLYYNYSFPHAQQIAESVLKGEHFSDNRKQLYISKNMLIHAIQRYCAENTDIEIEMCSDSANTIFDYMREAVIV